MGQIEAVGDLVHRQQFHRLRRPQTRHHRHQCLGCDACLAQVFDGQGSQTLRQFLALCAGQQAVMGKTRDRAAHGLDDLDLGGGVGHMVRAAHNVGDAHIDIIDRGREGIQHLTIRPDQHRVRHRGRVDGNRAQNPVLPLDPVLIQQEAPIALAPLGAQTGLVVIRQMQPGAVINRGLAHVQLLLALQVQLARRFKDLIQLALAAQILRRFGIAVQPLRLLFDAVPADPQPFQIAADPVHIFLLRAVPVGIVKAQDESAAGLARDQIVEQRRAQVADMDMPRGRGRKAGGGHGCVPLDPLPLSHGGDFVHIRGSHRGKKMTDWTDRTAPSADEIEAIARQVIATLPAAFAPHAKDLILRVEDFADDAMLDELEIDDPLELTGIYDGVPMTEKSASSPQHFPDTIWLFRRAIIDEWAERADVTLPDLVAHVTVHELAHHFGWSDDDIARIDRWWE